MKGAYRWHQGQKLKSRLEIEQVFKAGSSFFAPPVKVYYQWQEGPLQQGLADVKLSIGFSVSKKQFKKAVDRNRIKRLLREAVRLHKPKLEEALAAEAGRLLLFLVFTDRAMPAYSLVEEKVKYSMRRLVRIATERQAGAEKPAQQEATAPPAEQRETELPPTIATVPTDNGEA